MSFPLSQHKIFSHFYLCILFSLCIDLSYCIIDRRVWLYFWGHCRDNEIEVILLTIVTGDKAWAYFLEDWIQESVGGMVLHTLPIRRKLKRSPSAVRKLWLTFCGREGCDSSQLLGAEENSKYKLRSRLILRGKIILFKIKIKVQLKFIYRYCLLYNQVCLREWW